MKRYILAACAGLLAVAMATPSSAADLPRPAYKAPIYAPPAVFSWTGFYVGINGGYAWGTGEASNVFGSASADQDGWLLGGTLGYNLQTGVWVWGIEGDLDYAFINGNTSNTFAGCPGCEMKNTYFATARGRIGYAWDRFLPYITGGAAFSGFKFTAPGGSVTETNYGWTIGAGLEYAFLGAWSAKIEYLYADLGNGNCDAGTCGVSTDFETKVNVVRAGLNYRF
jgi:outer membrane immunogenic protein